MFKVELTKLPKDPILREKLKVGIVIGRRESQGAIHWRVDFGDDQQHWVKPCDVRVVDVVETVQPVRQVETGRTFKSIAEAARQMQVKRGAIISAIKRKGRSAGYRWEMIEEAIEA